MDGLSTRQRALFDFLAAYHGDGLGPAGRDAFSEDARCDLDTLVYAGLVDVIFIPRPQVVVEISEPAATVIAEAVAVAVAKPPVKPLGDLAPKASSPPKRRKQILATRAFDDERKKRFLEALAETGNVTKAHDAAGVKSALAYRERSLDAAFGEAWARALATFRALAVGSAAKPEPSVAARATPAPPASLAERAARATPTPPQRRQPTGDEIAAQALQRQQEQQRIKDLRPAMSVDEAKHILQRRGRIVHAASVTGGPAGRWVVSGFAEPIDDAMLKAEAERVEAQSAK